jgi:hypothetical protein
LKVSKTSDHAIRRNIDRGVAQLDAGDAAARPTG